MNLKPPSKVDIPEQTSCKEIRQRVESLLDEFPLPRLPTGSAFPFAYGTAGFRYDHSLLPSVMVRMGIFAVLRSHVAREPVGIMVTASHNKESDNGIKIADPDGGMLEATWEISAVALVNAPSTQDFITLLESMYAERNLKLPFAFFSPDIHHASELTPIIHIGRDTRPHSVYLSNLAIRAACLMGATVYDHGLLSTPQLHYIVMHSNPFRLPTCIPWNGWERGYFEQMVGAYVALFNTATVLTPSVEPRTLFVDCACGVGADKVDIIHQYLQFYKQDQGNLSHLPFLIALNRPQEGPLNHQCGAEYVQKNQCAPNIYSHTLLKSPMQGQETIASVDGDADRIVFTYQRPDGCFRLLDGDKIAVLISSFIQNEVSTLGEYIPSAKNLICGVVQTAYANGASTIYLKNHVHTIVDIAKTGVKYVHEKAHSFDIGTYFEANGHGTVVFGHNFYRVLSEAESIFIPQVARLSTVSTLPLPRALLAWQRLRLLPRLINQAVGDALSDLLLVDAILFLQQWSLQDWDSLYQDLPSRQCKIRIKDRNVVETNHDETKVTRPYNLQQAIDEVLASFQADDPAQVRAFVRPSGTEDVIRVYAEAPTQAVADKIAYQVANLAYDLCSGVGDRPLLLT